MVEYGFYTRDQIKEILPQLIELLDGTDDVYSISQA